MGGGRLREVVAHGGPSVYDIGLFHAYNSNKTYEQSLHLRMARGEGSREGINRKNKE